MQAVSAHIAFIADSGRGCHINLSCISFPHRNLQDHEGEEVTIFAHSNCDEVELLLNGKKIGKKQMPKNGHLTWKAIYQPGKVVAVGYKNGKRVLVETEETRIQLTCNADHLKDGTISVISYMIREFLYLLFIIIVLMYIISVYINL